MLFRSWIVIVGWTVALWQIGTISDPVPIPLTLRPNIEPARQVLTPADCEALTQQKTQRKNLALGRGAIAANCSLSRKCMAMPGDIACLDVACHQHECLNADAAIPVAPTGYLPGAKDAGFS